MPESCSKPHGLAHRFVRFVSCLSTLSGWCAAGMIIIAVMLTVQMIFIRFVLNGSTVWQTEAVIYLIVAATLIGLPYVQLLRGHVNVDLIPLSLRPEWRKPLAMITLSLACLIVGIMFWYGAEHWHFAFERNWRSDTIWGVRLWIPYSTLPLGFGLLFLQLFADLCAVITDIEPPFGIT